MLIPLYAFRAGDTLGLLVFVRDDEAVRDLAERLQEAAAVRVAPHAQAHVYLRGQRLDPDLTVSAAGITALDRIDVRAEDE